MITHDLSPVTRGTYDQAYMAKLRVALFQRRVLPVETERMADRLGWFYSWVWAAAL